MTDYLTQCNAITAEKKVWRWAKYQPNGNKSALLFREDDTRFIGSMFTHSRTEYLGDEYGNPIQATLGPQELWEKHEICLYPTSGKDKWIVAGLVNRWFQTLSSGHSTFAAALAEANRIAGGAQ